MRDIDTILTAFTPIGLADLEKVALLDRMDSKYMFTFDKLPAILESLSKDYFILEVNNLRKFHYKSLYFDTDNFKLFDLHSCGKLNRYKVRLRNYVESGISFFEIKFKSNKGRTVKNRIKVNDSEKTGDDAALFLCSNTPFSFYDLKAKIWVNYVRITLVSKNYLERLTFDIDLTFKNESKEVIIPELVIAELKQSRTGHSAFGDLMRESRIKKGSLSKYCFGIVSLIDDVRKNNFKEQILQINKLIHAAPARH